VPAEVGGGGGGGGGTPGTPSAAMVAAPSGDTEKDKQKDSSLPAFPSLPDEKEIEKWLKELLKEYEKSQKDGGGLVTIALMASSLTAEQATNNSMGFYIVLNADEDLNDDGVPDGLAAQFGLNPMNDLTQTDTDGDGLTDQQEIVNGTNPFKTDTDGDGASDAEEVSAGSDPNTPLGLPGLSAALYQESYNQLNDGTNGGSHFLYRLEWGVQLYESNRTVYAQPSNGEVGTTTVTVWPMQFAQIKTGTTTSWTDMVGGGKANITVDTNVPPPVYVRPFDGWWRKGNIDGTLYDTTLQVTTHGTNATLNRAYEFQLYSYNVTNSAWVPVTNFTGLSVGGQPLTTNGTCVLLLRENLRTNLTLTVPASMTNLVFTAGLTELTIDIQQVISDQIAGNECNSLPTAYFGDEGNNPMLLATRSGTDARIAVRASSSTTVQAGARVGVRKINTTTILASVPLQQSPAKTYLLFTAENGSKTYEVIAGYDFNSNGTLDANEVITVFSKTPKTDSHGDPVTKSLDLLDKLIIVTESDFETAKSRIGNWLIVGNVTFGFAADLLDAFANGKTNVPNAMTTFGVPISSSSPGLSHKVGAKWNANCEDTTYRFTYTNGSPASIAVRDSAGMTNVLDQVVRASLGDLLASGSPLFVSSTNIPISTGVDFIKTDKISKVGFAFGKVTFNGTMTLDYFISAPGEVTITRFLFDGSFDDTYDYAYLGKPLNFVIVSIDPKEPARVQAGHATLSTPAMPSGKVFFIHLDLNTGWRTVNRVYRP
jgi:hypothetical protein